MALKRWKTYIHTYKPRSGSPLVLSLCSLLLAQWLFPASLSRQSWRGGVLTQRVPLCVYTCTYRHLHLYSLLYLALYVVCIFIYTHINNSSPIRAINLVFCIFIFVTPFSQQPETWIALNLIIRSVYHSVKNRPSPMWVPHPPCWSSHLPLIHAFLILLRSYPPPYPIPLTSNWPCLGSHPPHKPHLHGDAVLTEGGLWATEQPLGHLKSHLALPPTRFQTQLLWKRRNHPKV